MHNKATHHKDIHKRLHINLNELVLDYLYHHPEKYTSTTTLTELQRWSNGQVKDPTPTKRRKTT